MADDQKFSKEVENNNPRSLEEFKKDPQSKLSDSFDRAKAAQQQKQQAPERQDSQQVKNSAPSMQPKPPSNVRGAVDRQAHNNSMAKDDSRVKEAQERANSINKNKENQPEQNKDKER